VVIHSNPDSIAIAAKNGNEVPLSFRGSAKFLENVPVPRAGRDYHAIGLLWQSCGELQSTLERARRSENLGMRRDAKKFAQDQIDKAEGLARTNDVGQPAAVR